MTQVFFILALVSFGVFVLSVAAAANTPTNSSGVVSIGALWGIPGFSILGMLSWLLG